MDEILLQTENISNLESCAGCSSIFCNNGEQVKKFYFPSQPKNNMAAALF